MSADERDFAEISEALITRMKEATESKTDSELARALEVSPQVIHNARKRKRIPPGWIFFVSAKFHISADWLIYGEKKKNLSRGTDQRLDASLLKYSPQTIETCVVIVEQALALSGGGIEPEQKASLITTLCFTFDFVENSPMRESFKDHALETLKAMMIESLSHSVVDENSAGEREESRGVSLQEQLSRYFTSPQVYGDKEDG